MTDFRTFRSGFLGRQAADRWTCIWSNLLNLIICTLSFSASKCVSLSETHTYSLPGFLSGSHPSFCLPHTLALCNTPLISNSFPEILHSNYQRRVRGTFSLWCTFGIFQIKGGTISSWHIINYTCRSFLLGRSSDTLENKSPDVVLNQRDIACEAGITWKCEQMAFLKAGVWSEAPLHQEPKQYWLSTTPLLLLPAFFFLN